jgi:hypothetical protein
MTMSLSHSHWLGLNNSVARYLNTLSLPQVRPSTSKQQQIVQTGQVNPMAKVRGQNGEEAGSVGGNADQRLDG